MQSKLVAVLLPVLVGLSMIGVAPTSAAQADGMAVVVNPGNAAANVSLGDLKKILAGAKRAWPGGQGITIITRGPGSPERFALLRLMGMSEGEYKQYWTAQVFRGDADAEPLIVPSIGMQKEAIKLYPGAITLVNAAEVKPGMKVLKVDGMLPGTPGYPIH